MKSLPLDTQDVVITNCSKIPTRKIAEAVVQESFPQDCRFSPDGLCVLTSRGHELVLYNTDSGTTTAWKPALQCPAGDSVRAYEWYPHMDSREPSTCCFVGTSRDQPVHLYDAYTGGIRATYRPYNRLDEMESPTNLCFAGNGQQIVTGGFRTDRMLHVFDLNRPGRDPAIVLKLGKTRRSKDGQKGLVSALAVDKIQNNLLAVGTYSPGSIYLYDLRTQSAPVSEIIVDGTCIVGHGKGHARKRKHFLDPLEEEDDTAHFFSAAKVQWYQSRVRGGVTQVEFSPEGSFLFTTSRRSNAVLQWDLRRLSSSSSFCPGIASFATCNDTNQRLGFVLEDNHLWIGGQDKCIRIYNVTDRSLVDVMDGFDDAVNGISIQKVGNRKLMATAVGSRRFPSEEDLDQEYPLQAIEMATSGWLHLFEFVE